MLIPNITTTRQIQTNYRAVFDQTKTDGPVVVMTNNKPDVVIFSVADATEMYDKARQAEMRDTRKAIHAYQKAKKANKLVRAASLAEFV